MKQKTTFGVVYTAIFAALICVATMLIRIPIPATGGYANLGDGIILICALILPPSWAALGAGIGSMIADLLAGYAAYAPATLIIKAGMGWIAAMLFQKGFGKDTKKLCLLASAMISEVWMILGYFAFEALILGMGLGAAAGIPGNIGQGAVGMLVAAAALPAVKVIKNKMQLSH